MTDLHETIFLDNETTITNYVESCLSPHIEKLRGVNFTTVKLMEIGVFLKIIGLKSKINAHFRKKKLSQY
jgi:hypothetical protein